MKQENTIGRGSGALSLRRRRYTQVSAQPGNKTITRAGCTGEKLGPEILFASIGGPVSAVTLSPPQWHAESDGAAAYRSLEGSMAPIDKSATARPIRFAVALPASWARRAAQMGGSENNGVIPRLTGTPCRVGPPLLQRGFATYGSDFSTCH